jgi:cytochrome c oxidase subunit III
MAENIFSKRREPFAFMLYLGIFGSCLLFFFIFLIFLKKEIINQNIPLQLPKVFWVSTLIMILSSVSLVLSKKYLEIQKFISFRIAFTSSFILGILFLVFQIIGWKQLLNSGLTMSNNTGASFLYILSALHLAHTLGGIVGMSLTLAKAYKNTKYVDAFVFSVNPPNQLNLKLISIYWHFLDILWLVIFLFMLYHAS